jgi:hypothetical protein
MKTIKLLFLLSISFLMSVNTFAQDEFYNDSPKENTTSIKVDSETSSDGNNIDNYTTERDYTSDNNRNNEVVIVDEEVIYEEERKKRQRRNRAEFAAEVFFDVIVNTAFIVVAFWQ